MQGGEKNMHQTSVQKQNKIYKNKGGNRMFKKMKHMKNEKGLTLIELLAVIVILAIVAAIAIPAIGNIINNSRDKAILSDALAVISGAKIAYMDGKCVDKTCAGTELDGYLDGISSEGLSVALNNDGKWVFTGFTKLGAFSGDEYVMKDGSTEEAIAKKLNNEE